MLLIAFLRQHKKLVFYISFWQKHVMELEFIDVSPL